MIFIEEHCSSKERSSEPIITLCLPENLYKRLKTLNIDIESLIIDSLFQELNLDPNEEYESRVELAKRFFEEGTRLIDEDPVQASEKLYKAAEEAIKALIIKQDLAEILGKVRSRGRWKTEDFFEAINILRERYGDNIRRIWNSAWTLHVWGFHEAKATKEYVKANIQDIRDLIDLLKKQ